MPIFEDFLQIDKNMVSLDKPAIHSPKKIHQILSDWGEAGRLKQFWLHISWDLLLPIIYFFFLGFLLAWLSKRGFSQKSFFQNLCLLSLVAVIDWLENLTLFILILLYPAKINFIGILKTAFTLIKYYVFGPAILFALIFSTIYAIKNKFKVYS